MRNAIDLSELQFDWGFDDTELKAPPISVRHVRTFRQKSEGVITTICPTCDTVAWVACSGDMDIVMYQTDGKEIKRIKLDFYIEDMKLTKLKNLLISASQTNFMKLVTTTSGDVTDFVSVHPYKSCGIHITSSRDVLVTTKGGTEGKVLKFSPSGEILRELVLDRASVPLYSSPDRVIQNSLGDIVVLDWKLKCIISVDDSWRTKFKYYGHDKNSEMYGNFTPSDIVCDKLIIC
ncbi:hypothetical protein FSP39_012636 [Pinctada imbricata]|uniref:Uncharacterized protein n=1 Tax=Pinctada imbricata TaxID=66713 RepID=A0AA88YCR1_PINIB|nr:hypothetical protein FSP39_012636 [Pinctada imbricata]